MPTPIDDSSLSQTGCGEGGSARFRGQCPAGRGGCGGQDHADGLRDKGEIYRYFISTFDNRGADVLEIQNAFSAKGYKQSDRHLRQGPGGLEPARVPTQEELDDAVRIIKQYTQFVQVKATLGQDDRGG